MRRPFILLLFICLSFCVAAQSTEQTVAGIVPDAPLPIEKLSEQAQSTADQNQGSPGLWGPQRSADPNAVRYSPYMRANPLIYSGYFNVNRYDYPGGRRLGAISGTTIGILATGNVYPLVAGSTNSAQNASTQDERATEYYQNRRADDFDPYLPPEPAHRQTPYDPYTDPANPRYNPWRNSAYGPYGPYGSAASRMWGNPFYGNAGMMDPFYSPWGYGGGYGSGYGSMYGSGFWPSMGLGIGGGGYWPSLGLGFSPFGYGGGYGGSGFNPTLGYNYFDTTYRYWR